STAVRITAWCPRWIPSNVPWATTLGDASGGYWSSPRTIRMDETEQAQSLGRRLPDAEKARAGIDPAGRGRLREADGHVLRQRDDLPLRQAAAGLRRGGDPRQVRDRPVGGKDTGGQRGGVAPLDHGPGDGIRESEGP